MSKYVCDTNKRTKLICFVKNVAEKLNIYFV